jgi:hypothetical protein
MSKHRSFSFKTDKYLKSVDSRLRDQYFLNHHITLPANINFNDDSFDEFWYAIEEEKRVDIEEELQCINDIADCARDCLERACQEYSILKEENETPETTAMRVYLHSEEAFSLAFDYYLYYSILSEKLIHHRFRNVTADFAIANVSRFKSAIEQYFRNCGKSGHCDIRERD